MPVYEYECGACGHRFEEWQKMSDKPIKTCPKCNAKKVAKLISQTSFHLKGGGWYSDLYSSSKGGSGGKGESGGSGGSSGSETKKETAPAPATESKVKETKESPKPKKGGGGKTAAAS